MTHPSDLLTEAETTIGRVNEWAATHLATLFGLVWTVWLFVVVPLLVLLLPSGARSVVFYLASGWIQLWALPLFVYVGNRLQKTSDAQSDAQHVALTHIATTLDQAAAHIAELAARQQGKSLVGFTAQLAAADPDITRTEAAWTVLCSPSVQGAGDARLMLEALGLEDVYWQWDIPRVALVALHVGRRGQLNANTIRDAVPDRAAKWVPGALKAMRRTGLIEPASTVAVSTAPGARGSLVRDYRLTLAGRRLAAGTQTVEVTPQLTVLNSMEGGSYIP